MSIRSIAAVGMTISASVAALAFAFFAPIHTAPSGDQRPAPDFENIDAWFNSEPLKMEGLRGKVVPIDFWTYTCFNCLNHLPSVQDWHTKYKDKGLVVVGIHTPEFAFEKSSKNVQDAVRRLGIKHPVAQDNGYATWKAFNNQYWPAVYLIDKQGRVVYWHYGEGKYAETEAKIQALLAEPLSEPGAQ